MNGEQKIEKLKLPELSLIWFAAHQLKTFNCHVSKSKKDTALLYFLFHYLMQQFQPIKPGNKLANGKSIAEPLGMLHPNIAPYGERFTCVLTKR